MEFKKFIGWMLLFIMVVTAYGLFGSVAVEKELKETEGKL